MRLKIGIRRSPHLELLAESITRHGDQFVDVGNTGADFWLAWGWPQAEQCMREGADSARIICVDAHPFALAPGARSGERIFQLGNWGALAKYPPWNEPYEPPAIREQAGPVLVLGQVYTAQQGRDGLVDVWHTGGYETWVQAEMAKPLRRFRKHPRVWTVENTAQLQPSLIDDLQGCSAVASWNSTAAVHARMLGYRALPAAEAHGWAHMALSQLAGLRVAPETIRSGVAWERYRTWLVI